MPFRNHQIANFGGLNQDEDPHAIGLNELIQSLNIAHYGGSIGTRPGTTREAAGKDYENALGEASAVTGLHEHRENVDANRSLLAVTKSPAGPTTGEIAYQDGASLPAGSTTITYAQDNIWTMATHNNLTWGAGGATGDSFWHWDGNTAAAPTALVIPDSAGATIDPKYVFAWRNHLFINGMVGGVLADNNPSATRFVEPNTDPTVAANWKAGNTIGFNAFGTSHTTGFSSYRDNNGDFLLILTNTDIASVELTSGFPFFRVTDAIQNGCVHQRAYVSLGVDSGDAIFMSDKGFHSLRQSQQHGNRSNFYLSWKIRPFFESLNQSRKKFSVGAYDFINGRVIFSMSTGSNTSHNRLLVLDIDNQAELTAKSARWSIWQLGIHPVSGNQISINELKMLRDQDDVWRMYFGTTDGDVGYFTDDVFRDLGSAPYSVVMQTPHADYGSILNSKTLGDVMITLQPGGNYKPIMRFHFDYGARSSQPRQLTMSQGAGGQWGTAQWGAGLWGTATATRDEKVYGSGSGRTISFEVQHTGANEPFRVAKIDHQIDLGGEDTGDVSNAA